MEFQLKNQPKVIRAWCFYDWANSVYNLIINTAIFPIYYTAVTQEAFQSDQIEILGYSITNTVAYTYAISISYFLIVFLSLMLSGVADYSGRKKFFMQIFATLGAIACTSMYFFTGKNVEFGLICVILASIGYAGSLVFYNAFLPEIVTEDKMDEVSAKGFSYGYFGSIILLIINLLMVMKPQLFGLASAGDASRISFVLVAIWWIGFAQIPFRALTPFENPKPFQLNSFQKGFQEISKVFRLVKRSVSLSRFLLSFFFLSMGVQTVILLASIFGEKVVGMESTELILVILIVQIVAIFGAWFFSKISQWKGTKWSLMIALIGWLMLCMMAYQVHEKNSFYLLAALLGCIMGGIQSQSRSMYSKLLPENQHDSASFFSYYDILEKFAIVIGTFSYGTIEALTGSLRNSILALSAFFVISLLVMIFVPEKQK